MKPSERIAEIRSEMVEAEKTALRKRGMDVAAQLFDGNTRIDVAAVLAYLDEEALA